MLQNPLVMNTPVTTHYLSSSSFEQTQAQCSEDQPLKVWFFIFQNSSAKYASVCGALFLNGL